MNKEEIRTIVEWSVKITAMAEDDKPECLGNPHAFLLEVPLDDGQDQVGVIECNKEEITLIAEEEDSVNEIAWGFLKEKAGGIFSISNELKRINLYEEES